MAGPEPSFVDRDLSIMVLVTFMVSSYTFWRLYNCY